MMLNVHVSRDADGALVVSMQYCGEYMVVILLVVILLVLQTQTIDLSGNYVTTGAGSVAKLLRKDLYKQ
jgi:hypothetical protein